MLAGEEAGDTNTQDAPTRRRRTNRHVQHTLPGQGRRALVDQADADAALHALRKQKGAIVLVLAALALNRHGLLREGRRGGWEEQVGAPRETDSDPLYPSKHGS